MSPTSRASPPPIFVPLAEANINVDMIVQNISEDGDDRLTFTVPPADYERAWAVLRREVEAEIGFQDLEGATDVAKVSVIGIGMRSHAGVAAKAFRALAERASTSAPSRPRRSSSPS